MPRIGDALDENVLIGPLHTETSVKKYKDTIDQAVKAGGKIEFGGKVLNGPGYFVEPTIISGLPHDSPLVHNECFAPIVYILEANNLKEAISWNNEVNQGLSSSLFTTSIEKMFDVRLDIDLDLEF